MPAPHPAEFRARAVELARERAKPIAVLAKDLGISESCLHNWMVQADVDSGVREGLTTPEREELVRLRRENRVLRMGEGDPGKSSHGGRWRPPPLPDENLIGVRPGRRRVCLVP